MATDFTVLVVEDEPLIQMELVDRLERAGGRTVEAGSAEEAISVLEARTDITVVFTDIQMPGTMDGISLATYIRGRWPPTIVVVSSGNVIPVAGALANDVRFMSKPYDDQTFHSVISDVRARLA